jgi:ribonuclease HI
MLSIMVNEENSEKKKIISKFGLNLICTWLYRSGFEVISIDHAIIDVIAYNSKNKRRIGISINSTIQPIGNEKKSIDLFGRDKRVKILEACKSYVCEPWIAIYVETMNYSDLFLISLDDYESKYYRGTKLAEWKMESEDIKQYDQDANVMHLHLIFEPRNWFPISVDSKMKISIYSDGASRGNPGNAALSFIILSSDGKRLRRYSKYIGIKTNNQAEYLALISALNSASLITGGEVICYSDSELLVRQLKGIYKIRNSTLRELWWKVKEIEKRFKKVVFVHVQRENNYIQEVDKISNTTLDQIME